MNDAPLDGGGNKWRDKKDAERQLTFIKEIKQMKAKQVEIMSANLLERANEENAELRALLVRWMGSVENEWLTEKRWKLLRDTKDKLAGDVTCTW